MAFMKVIHVLGWLMGVEAVLMLIPGANAYFAGDLSLSGTFFASALLTLFFASVAVAATTGISGARFGAREQGAFLLLIWPVLAFCAAIPFYFGGYAKPANALFEAISGITTTGATMLTQPENVADAILLWRAILQAFGGLISIVVTLVILVSMRNGGLELSVGGVPGRERESMTARLAKIATFLAPLYGGLIVVGAIALSLAGMRGLDAFCYAASAVSTGGFSTHHLGPAYYESQVIHGLLSILMLFGALNIVVVWSGVFGRKIAFKQDSEWRYLLATLVIVSLLLVVLRMFDRSFAMIPAQLVDLIFAAFFATASFISTTAFVGSDFKDLLAPPAVVLMLLLILGGCSGSTAGGVKILRAIVMMKHTGRELARLSHPHGIVPIRVNDTRVQEAQMHRVWTFFLVFLLTVALATWGLTLLSEVPAMTALTTAVAMLSNAGPAVEALSADATPMLSQPTAVKWFLCFVMIIGRVEILAFLLLITPAFWRQ